MIGRDPLSYASRPKVKKSRTLLRISKYLWRYKLFVILALFLSIISNVLALMAPKLSGLAIDAISPGKGNVLFDKVLYYVVMIIICYVVSAVFSYLLTVIMVVLGQRITRSMRRDVFNKLTSLPVGFFDVHQAGDMISRISYDIDMVNTSLSQDFLTLFTSVITIIGAFINMVIISPVMLSVFLVTIPLSILFTLKKTKKLHPLYRKRSYALGSLNGYVEETITGQKTVKAYGTEDKFIESFDKYNSDATAACQDSDYQGTVVGPSVNLINNISISLISTFGAVIYLLGMLKLGDISAFILFSRKFAGPISEISTIFNELQSAIAAAERVFGLLDEPDETADAPDAEVLGDVCGNVEFRNVSFGYTEDTLILKNISFTASKGEQIAIVGPTGAGKTTIINLLMRFYDVNDGQIFIDGNEIRSVTRDSLRKAFTMVLQDTWLFEGTIADNISYGNGNVPLDKIKEAARTVGIDKYIESLPGGYNASVTDNGINISKGQKQLLTIARAMISDSKMLILDEATSNVDTRTEENVQRAMRKLMEDRTCFVIAHRLSTIKNADKIIVIDGGRIVECGTHKELIEAGGTYAAMHASQFM
ncbi:MAG: ABC transporter ATP-binding protein [Clostridia bacterium]|nr:ABC transporter ATP-binding protein [Clostridia bacterium]